MDIKEKKHNKVSALKRQNVLKYRSQDSSNAEGQK